jgi:uncharacterized protein (UPF0262 family)
MADDKPTDKPTTKATDKRTVSLVDVLIDDVTWGCATRIRRAEWLQQITELSEESRFDVLYQAGDAPVSALRAYITVEPTSLRVVFHDERGDERGHIELSRGVIGPVFREYFSLLSAISTMGAGAYSPQVEALDIARRLMHNDAADLVIRHATRVVPDHRTARHLFTLFLLVTHDTTRLHTAS